MDVLSLADLHPDPFLARLFAGPMRPRKSSKLSEASPIISLAQERASRAAYKVEHQLYQVENATIAQIKAELEVARAGTIAVLSTATKDWQIAQAQALLVEIERQMKAWQAVASNTINGRFGDVTDLGVEQVMSALKAGGVGFNLGAGPMISRDFVAVAYQTLPYLIKDVSDEVVRKVGSIMRQSVLAQTGPFEAMKAVGTLSGKGVFNSAFLRGETIVRTEYGRIAQTANYTALTDIAKDQPTLQRQWSAVLDIRTRPSHAAASGEVRAIDKPYSIGGFDAMYPHDPNLPARESVDCRCISIPFDKSWETDSLGAKAEQAPAPSKPAPFANPDSLMAGAHDYAHGLTVDQGRNLVSYAYNSSRLNPMLREGKTDPAFSVDHLDAAIAKGSVPSDMSVYRVAPSSLVPPGSVGMEFADKAYLSTAVDDRWLDTFSNYTASPAVYRIRVPKGTPAVYLDAVREAADREWAYDPSPTGELLLGRNTKLRVTGESVDAKSRRLIDAEVIQ